MDLNDESRGYIFRGDSLDGLRHLGADRYFRATIDMELGGACSHPGLSAIRREAVSHGASHFRLSFWSDLANALSRYSFRSRPSVLLRFREADLRDRGFRFSQDEHTGEGGIVASVIDKAVQSERFPRKLSSTGIPLESIDVLCPDNEWRPLPESGALDDSDICESAFRFDIPFSTGTARGCAWFFAAIGVVYVRQRWDGGCYLAGDPDRSLVAAMEIARGFDLGDPGQYRWFFEIEPNQPARNAEEVRLIPLPRNLRQRLSRAPIEYALDVTARIRGKRGAWLEELGQPAITAGQWRWLRPVLNAAAKRGIATVDESM